MAAAKHDARESAPEITPQQVLAYRRVAQQLDRAADTALSNTAVLDLGVQDTGPDGAGWALVNRGVDASAVADSDGDLVLVWTLRGAPHFYRRADIAAVAAATAPFSAADAGKRIFDANRPLQAAGIAADDALDVIANHLRQIVSRPTVKGAVSTELTARLGAPYLRHCRPCNATHVYEQPFRLAALRAGLELQPKTSPPVLQRIASWHRPAKRIPKRLQVIRAYLHLLGPATPKSVAGYLDAPVADVQAHWPVDSTPVRVEGETRELLCEDLEMLQVADADSASVRLLSPFDLFLQARDRDLLVADASRRKRLWPVLGRPGAVLSGAQIVGIWRPRASGGRLRLAVERWAAVPEPALAEQAERLAAYRGLRFAGFTEAG